MHQRPNVKKPLPRILNSIYSGGVSSVVGVGSICVSTFMVLWVFSQALGVTGSLETFFFLAVASLFVPALLALLLAASPVRWALIVWLLRRELPAISNFDPSLIIGLGPGGAIIAGMLSKLLAHKATKEPIVAVVDRRFNWEGVSLAVSLEEVGYFAPNIALRFPNVLLVTSEIHTGNTMQAAYKRLAELEVNIRSFSFCANPVSSFKPDFVVVPSDKTGILPWGDSPDRLHGASR